MTSRSCFTVLFLVSTASLLGVACSSSSDAASSKPDFCSVSNAALQRCGAATCASFTSDCSKIAALVSPVVLDAATSCMQTNDCSGGGPLSCLGTAATNVEPTE